MKPTLFDKTATAFDSLGVCRLPDAISCTVTEELNGAFELEMVYPVSGRNFSEIAEDMIIAAAASDGGTKQAFRIYRIETPINGQVTIYARHISYQLNFIPITPVSGTGTAQAMMTALSGAALETCPFTFSSYTSSSANYTISEPTSLRSALGGMEGSLRDTYAGDFEWDNWTVYYKARRGADNGVRITYGKNLTDVTRAVDIGETITGIVAYYYDEANNAYVYTSPKVISNGNESNYAFGRTIVYDATGEFDAKPTAAELKTWAQSFIAATSMADISEAVEVNFVALWQSPEYAQYAALERVSLGDTVYIGHRQLGIEVTKRVTRTVYNVLLDRYDSIELGGADTVSDTIAELSDDSSSATRTIARINSQGPDYVLKNGLASYVDISSYNSSGNKYTIPADGYLYISNNSSQTGEGLVYGAGGTTAQFRIGNAAGRYSVFVRKGMQTYLSGTSYAYRYIKIT